MRGCSFTTVMHACFLMRVVVVVCGASARLRMDHIIELRYECSKNHSGNKACNLISCPRCFRHGKIS